MFQKRTSAQQTKPVAPTTTPPAGLGELLSRSGDEFYGTLQRILNTVVLFEDSDLSQNEPDTFEYAQRRHHHSYV